MSLTVGVLVARAGEILCGRPTADTNLSARIKWALHASMLTIIEETNLKSLYSESCIALNQGQSDYALEADLHRLNAASVFCEMSNGEVYVPPYVDNESWITRGGKSRTGTTDRVLGYSLLSIDKADGCFYMRVFPDEVRDGTTLNYGYYARPKDIHDLADADEIDRRIDDSLAFAILHGAMIDFTDLLHQDQIAAQAAKYREKMAVLGKRADPVVGNVRQRQTMRLRGPMGGAASSYRGSFAIPEDLNY